MAIDEENSRNNQSLLVNLLPRTEKGNKNLFLIANNIDPALFPQIAGKRKQISENTLGEIDGNTTENDPKKKVIKEESDRKLQELRRSIEEVSKLMTPNISEDDMKMHLGKLTGFMHQANALMQAAAAQGIYINPQIIAQMVQNISNTAYENQINKTLATPTVGIGPDGNPIAIDPFTGQPAQEQESDEDKEKKHHEHKDKHKYAKDALDFEKSYKKYSHMSDEEVKAELNAMDPEELKKLMINNEVDLLISQAGINALTDAKKEFDEELLRKAKGNPDFSHLEFTGDAKKDIENLKKDIERKQKNNDPIANKPETKELYKNILISDERQKDIDAEKVDKVGMNKFKKNLTLVAQEKNITISNAEVSARFDVRKAANDNLANLAPEVKSLIEQNQDMILDGKADIKESKIEALLEEVDLEVKSEELQERDEKAHALCEDMKDDLDIPFNGDAKAYLSAMHKELNEKPELAEDEIFMLGYNGLSALYPEVNKEKTSPEIAAKLSKESVDKNQSLAGKADETAKDAKQENKTPEEAKEAGQNKESKPEQSEPKLDNDTKKAADAIVKDKKTSTIHDTSSAINAGVANNKAGQTR